ncbi:MAG TPA: porin family protein [Ohtaekwangia sp.]
MKTLSVLLFVLTPFALVAQGIGLGIKAGANFADAKMESLDVKSATSFHAGGYLNLNFSETFGIRPEVLWTGYKSKVDGDLGDVDFERNYIAIPVMLCFKPIPLLSLEAGPQFNILLNAEADGDDIKNQLKKNEFGLGVGAGLHLPLGLNAGVRYIVGFTNISDADPTNPNNVPEDIKNRTFQIYAGWTLFGGN